MGLKQWDSYLFPPYSHCAPRVQSGPFQTIPTDKSFLVAFYRLPRDFHEQPHGNKLGNQDKMYRYLEAYNLGKLKS